MPHLRAKKLFRPVRRFLRSNFHLDIGVFNPYGSLGTYLTTLFFPAYGINCVLDVGANHGEYALQLRDEGFSGHIVSFEPISKDFSRLMERSANDPRWIAQHLALGSEARKGVFNYFQGSTLSSSFEPTEYGLRQFGETFRMQGQEIADYRRLDDVIDEYTAHITHPKVFLKIDTQGDDLRVLHGADRVLPRLYGIQCEMPIKHFYKDAPTDRQIRDYLEEKGYDIAAMFPLKTNAYLSLDEYDCVFVRRSNEAEAP